MRIRDSTNDHSTHNGQTLHELLTLSLQMGRVGPTNLGQPKETVMNKVDVVAGILVIVGALNWGLVAIAEFDLVAALFGLDFGETNAATRVVYALVGLSGLWMAARVPALTGR